MSKKNKKKNKNKVIDNNEPKKDIVKFKNGIENGLDEVSNEDKPTEKSKSCDLCEISGAVTCSKCKSVTLCNNCMVRHIYAGKCSPWIVSKLPDGGKCLTASRVIKPLEVVIQDTSVVTVPTGKLSCVGCGRQVNCLYKCPVCHLPMCGTQCPRKSCHEVECKVLQQGSQQVEITGDEKDKYHPLLTAVGCIRLLQLKLDNKKLFSSLAGLNRKLDLIKQDTAACDTLEQVKKILAEYNYEESDIEECYSLIKLYGYTLSDLEDGKVRSLFPIQSLLSHSCLPNLQYIEKEDGRKLVLQATTKIEKGEKLTVRYTPFLQGRLSLKKWIIEQRYVDCSCARCVDATELGTFTSSALCDQDECKERGGLLLPIDPSNYLSDWLCTSCQIITKHDEVQKIEDKYVEKFRELPQGNLTAYYRFLNELGDRFHASHHLVMRMAQFLVLLQGKRLESLPRERIETQSMLCDKLLFYVSKLDPGATQNRAKLLLEKNKADLNLSKLDYEAGKITRNVFMARIKEGVRVEVNAKKILYFKWDD